jgi:hypothetical protein
MMRLYIESYKHLPKHRTAFCGLICTFLLFIVTLVFNIPAFAVSTYTVENIRVDVSAANAVEAREKAFEEAQIKGYKKLAQRFFDEANLEAMGTPDINTVAVAVKDFEVSKEKISATRYAGTYKISYDARAFENRASITSGNQNATSISNTKGHILVLPFFEDSGYSMLWRTNPFLQAWNRARDGGYAAPSIIPAGDSLDMVAISDSQALNYNPASLEDLKNRYGASQVAILIAKPELMPDGAERIMIGIYQANTYGPQLAQQISVRGNVGESKDQFYARAVKQVNQVFNESWQRRTALSTNAPSQSSDQQVRSQAVSPQSQALSGPVQTMLAQVEFSTMRGWMDTKRAMENSRGVRGISVKSLSPRSATVIISYQGSLDQLRSAFGQNGVNLNNPFGAGVYRISSRY